MSFLQYSAPSIGVQHPFRSQPVGFLFECRLRVISRPFQRYYPNVRFRRYRRRHRNQNSASQATRAARRFQTRNHRIWLRDRYPIPGVLRDIDAVRSYAILRPLTRNFGSIPATESITRPVTAFGQELTFMSTVLQSEGHSMATRDSTEDGQCADSQQNPMQPLN
jgi:hypothetical protein